MLAIDLETFVPVHAHADREVEMADRAVGEVDVDEPAIGSEALVEPRVDRSISAPPRKRAVSTRWLPWASM